MRIMQKGERKLTRSGKCFNKLTEAKQLLVKLHLHKNEVDLGSVQSMMWRSLGQQLTVPIICACVRMCMCVCVLTTAVLKIDFCNCELVHFLVVITDHARKLLGETNGSHYKIAILLVLHHPMQKLKLLG